MSETTTLLRHGSLPDKIKTQLVKMRSRIFPTGYCKEVKEVWKIVWPLVLTMFLQYASPTIALIFCGRLGTNELDSVALANSIINMTCITAANGLASACDTLFSQLYGSKNTGKLFLVLQKGVMILGLCVLPCWAIHLNVENFLVAVGSDPAVAYGTGSYLLFFLPGTMAFYIYCVLCKFLQNQNMVYPNLVIGVLSNIINILLHYILINIYYMGINGSAIAQAVNYFCMCIFTGIYICCKPECRALWNGFEIESLREWGVFFKLAVFGMAMTTCEWWFFEMGIILSGRLGNIYLATQSLIFNIYDLGYMIPSGTSVAASIRVGQNLGAHNARGAFNSATVVISVVLMLTVVEIALFLSLRWYLPRIFTDDIEIITMVSSLLPSLCIFTTFDNISCVSMGILRGQGRQMFGCIVLFITYAMGAALAISVMLCTPGQLLGYWLSMGAGLAIQAISFLYALHKTDWDKQVEKTKGRVGDSITDEKDVALPQNDSDLKVSSSYSTDTVTQTNISGESDVLMPNSQSESWRSVFTYRILNVTSAVILLVLGVVLNQFVSTPDTGIDMSETSTVNMSSL